MRKKFFRNVNQKKSMKVHKVVQEDGGAQGTVSVKVPFTQWYSPAASDIASQWYCASHSDIFAAQMWMAGHPLVQTNFAREKGSRANLLSLLHLFLLPPKSLLCNTFRGPHLFASLYFVGEGLRALPITFICCVWIKEIHAVFFSLLLRWKGTVSVKVPFTLTVSFVACSDISPHCGESPLIKGRQEEGKLNIIFTFI